MKKVYVILLGLFLAFAGSAFAADINDVSSEAWIDHVSQMQVMRQQILNLVTRQNPTAEDKEMLNALQKSFTEKKNEWDSYLQSVADGTKEVKEICGACGQNPCACVKAPSCSSCDTSKAKVCKKIETKRSYHRYNKKPRRNQKNDYHRYTKNHRENRHGMMKAKKGCKCPKCSEKKAKKMCSSKTSKCASKCGDKAAKCAKKEVKCNDKKNCPTCPKYKSAACCKVSGVCSEKKAKKMCSSKTSKCASKCDDKAAKCAKKEVKCNDKKNCPTCPKYKSAACCKVSGVCSEKKAKKMCKKGCGCPKCQMKKMNKTSCPMCNELKLMKINMKCSKCAK